MIYLKFLTSAYPCRRRRVFELPYRLAQPLDHNFHFRNSKVVILAILTKTREVGCLPSGVSAQQCSQCAYCTSTRGMLGARCFQNGQVHVAQAVPLPHLGSSRTIITTAYDVPSSSVGFPAPKSTILVYHMAAMMTWLLDISWLLVTNQDLSMDEPNSL